MNFLKRLFGAKKKVTDSSKFPERPPGWNLTWNDLQREMKEGRRTHIGQPEMAWAEDYERSLIPGDYRYPRKGDIYESAEDQTVEFQTDWAMPYTGGGEGTLFKGERVRIRMDVFREKPVFVYADPVEYKKLEERFVPEKERKCPKYGRFSLCLTTVELNTKFRLIRGRK